VAPSASSGAIRKQRGVKPGVPDILVLYRGKLTTIELKSRHGKCSPPQRAVREDLLRAGARGWWVCRTACAAMWALRKSGVKFRTRPNDDGTLECWQQPKLPAWEIPKRPHERRPRAPDYWEPDDTAEIAKLAGASDDAAGSDIAATKQQRQRAAPQRAGRGSGRRRISQPKIPSTSRIIVRVI
jgi:hypothetical protein